MEMTRHQYLHLEDNDTIRILTLEPGPQDAPLIGSLQVVPIECTQEYEALSYVWADPGPPDIAYTILIRHGKDEARLLTLRGGSIFAALRRLRFPDKSRRIWADQCCINQDDPLERSQQVQYMNRIYHNAAHVLVWLGLDFEGQAASTFALIRELEEILHHQLSDNILQRSREEKLATHMQENWQSIQAFTDCVYFKRGWVVQEIGTNAPATILWGNAMIEWELLATVCENLKQYHQCRSTLGITTSNIAFLFKRFIEPNENTHHANRFNFVYELQRARHLRFTDDRDRVFAFLGHYSLRSLHPLGCGPTSITADYTKSVEKTYIDVAVQILRANVTATCVVLAAVQHPAGSLPSLHRKETNEEIDLGPWLENPHTLPSWVPDWRRSLGIIFAEPICPHYAHGTSISKIDLLGVGSGVLRVHGVEIDTIRRVTDPIQSNDFYQTKTSEEETTVVERIWREVCGRQCFNLEDRYLDGQVAFFAFMQTLSNGCVQAAGHDGRLYHEVPGTVWLREAAKYIVQTQEPGLISSDLRSAADDANYDDEPEQWSRWATSASDGRSFAITKKGYYVLGPAALEPGDVVCVLFGCKVPFCLRPFGKRYLLMGECYVHGLMAGEAMKMMAEGAVQERRFDIL